MSQEKLREALDWLVHLYHGVSKGGDWINSETGERMPMAATDDEWVEAIDEAMDALEAPSEMQRLVEWLEERAKSYIGREVGRDTYSGISVSPVRRQELEIVLGYIRTEFKEGDDATE